jgi:hypothetical protein
MKALVVGTRRDQVTKAQWEPFFYYRKELECQLNLNLETKVAETFSEISQVCEQEKADVVFVIPFWKESASNAEVALAKIRNAAPHGKIIFIDPWAQASSRYFNTLPYVDSLLKRQRYRDLQKYRQDFEGGTMFTEFLAKEWDFDLQGWEVSSKVHESFLARITTGWNLGIAKRFMRQIQKPQLLNIFEPAKTIDIFCRISVGQRNDWYSRYRQESVKAIRPLEKYYYVAISGKHPNKLVSRRQYYRELKRSKIVFSPFGWGENCWRDFEAVCHNCLLVKPSMAHLHTQPNLFIEEETYVPVQWDYSDLEDKLRYYLRHWEEAQEIIKTARKAYQAYFQEQRFIKTIKKVIS